MRNGLVIPYFVSATPAIVSLLLKLDWGKLPEFTNEILKNNPNLWIILFIAALGFFISASFVITSPNR